MVFQIRRPVSYIFKRILESVRSGRRDLPADGIRTRTIGHVLERAEGRHLMVSDDGILAGPVERGRVLGRSAG